MRKDPSSHLIDVVREHLPNGSKRHRILAQINEAREHLDAARSAYKRAAKSLRGAIEAPPARA